jgi:hypothetical protein
MAAASPAPAAPTTSSCEAAGEPKAGLGPKSAPMLGLGQRAAVADPLFAHDRDTEVVPLS